MPEIRVRTSKAVETVHITGEVLNAIKGKEGKLVHVYTPHTTCGLVINEFADPDVMRDIVDALEQIAPTDRRYRHREGNAHAHIKSSLTGCSVTIPFSDGECGLGTWQGIFLMEFDGPRDRRVIVTVL